MFNPKQAVKEAIEKEFGQLNARQLWAVTKLAKFVRLRARNNAAYNNAMNEIFPYARFRTVTKTRVNRYNPAMVESYPGLEISVSEIKVPAMVCDNMITVPGETISGDEGEENN
jgi:hypothetical protein